MQIMDLYADNQDAIRQAANLLVEGFKQHWPNAWPDMKAALAEVQEAFEPNRINRMAVDDDGTVLGWIGAIREYDGHAWELHPLVVHPDYQGKGIGRALLTDLEGLVNERGGVTLYLGTDDANDMTTLSNTDLYPDVTKHMTNIKNLRGHPYEFYQKLGFVIAGVIPDANGLGKPDIIMAKRVGRTMKEQIQENDRFSSTQRETPKLYAELASWWHLLSAPTDYAEEAAFFHKVLTKASGRPPKTLLELGSGGGNNASHLKKHYEMTLVDRSAAMLAVSRDLNPECEHIEGDMRSVRLRRVFDVVFIHDAIMYMTTSQELRRAIETASVHCRKGGAALFAPDHTRETFRPSTRHGGHDDNRRGIRYLEWTYDPNGEDMTYITEFAYLLKEEDGRVRAEYDRHICGLFSREEWKRFLQEIGFEVRVVPDSYGRELFVGVKQQ